MGEMAEKKTEWGKWNGKSHQIIKLHMKHFDQNKYLFEVIKCRYLFWKIINNFLFCYDFFEFENCELLI